MTTVTAVIITLFGTLVIQVITAHESPAEAAANRRVGGDESFAGFGCARQSPPLEVHHVRQIVVKKDMHANSCSQAHCDRESESPAGFVELYCVSLDCHSHELQRGSGWHVWELLHGASMQNSGIFHLFVEESLL